MEDSPGSTDSDNMQMELDPSDQTSSNLTLGTSAGEFSTECCSDLESESKKKK